MIDRDAMTAIQETAREAVKQLEAVADMFDLANSITTGNFDHKASMSDDARKFLFHVTEQMFSIVQNKYNIRRTNSN